ncbi:MAG: hypothetical protein AB8G99_25400 [Planctomycetaceae bacterium]
MKKLTASVKKFHNDESGMEALQTVVILAVASLVLVGIYEMWGTKDSGIRGTITDQLEKVMKNGKTQ